VCNTKAHAVTDPREFELVEQTLRRALEDENFDFLPLIERAKRQSGLRISPGIEFPTYIAMDNKTHPMLIDRNSGSGPARTALRYSHLSLTARMFQSRFRVLTRRLAQRWILCAVVDRFTAPRLPIRAALPRSRNIFKGQFLVEAPRTQSKERGDRFAILLFSFCNFMNVLILAAGYATRLYPLTLNKAKPLLPVGSKPIIEWVVEKLVDVPDLETVYIVTNDKFARDFKPGLSATETDSPNLNSRSSTTAPKATTTSLARLEISISS
jgi:hypothetical protein